ncbi:hypothetical protein D7030_14080 [Flavobacteriaceae bacterium AU392]|nr:hypothetical protein D1817_04410 [Flavobacteriaceae bacterium]RKM81431.1 hypothetical protein D7030_14080 [Flavobacteriaceae bacterium AU392]
MKSQAMKCFTVIVFLFSQAFIFSQDCEIPFEEDGWIILEVTVNDSSEKLRFVFDTGFGSPAIDKSIADKLGIKPKYIMPNMGVSGAAVFGVASKQKINFEDFSLKRLDFTIADLSHIKLSPDDEPIQGILGYSLISKFVTQIDFKSRSIKLYEKIKDINDLNTYTKHHIGFDRTSPVIPVKFTLERGKEISGNFIFDTGNIGTLDLSSPFVDKHNLVEEIKEIRVGSSLGFTGHESKILRGKVKSINFNNIVFDDVTITLSRAKKGVLSQNITDGLLGVDILYKFHIILDYKNNAIYLKPKASINQPVKLN